MSSQVCCFKWWNNSFIVNQFLTKHRLLLKWYSYFDNEILKLEISMYSYSICYKLLKDRKDLRRYNMHIFFWNINCIIKFGIFLMKHISLNRISFVDNEINRMNIISPTKRKIQVYLNFCWKIEKNDRRLNTGTHSSIFHFVRPFFFQTGGYRPEAKSVNRRNADKSN